MTKVAFIQKSCYEKVNIHYLAGALRDANIEYQLFIEDLEEDFYGELLKYNPSYVFYSMCTREEVFVLELFGKIKELMPYIKTLLGGYLTPLFPELCKREEIDYVFRVEEEFALPKFVKALESKKNVKDIDGICFIDEAGKEYKNSNLRLVDLKDIPKPDRNVYYKYDILRNSPTKSFIASRGCPYRCTYCQRAAVSKYFQSKYWRQRDITDVIDEIRDVKEKYGLKWVRFEDATFTADKKWLRSFLEAYSEADLPQFLCNARAETIDEEIVRLLKKAGCNRITFGLQSGNLRISQELMSRSKTNNQIIKACQLCKEYGIRVGVDIIFGWPGETLEEAMDTIRLCRKINVEEYHSNVLMFFPGTQIAKYAYENGYISTIPTLEDISRLNPNQSLLTNEQKNLLINMDKLFYCLIKFPRFERLFLRLLKLPPNKIFLLLKNIHILVRSLKYDNTPSKFKIVLNYLVNCWKAENEW